MGGDDTDGLRALYEDHVDDVYEFVHRRCRDQALAEDVTQDVFVAIAQSGVDPSDLTIEWLLRTARNRMIDVVRRAANGDRKERIAAAVAAEPDHSAVTATRVTLESALERLPVRYRIVLTLQYLDGMTVAELADEIGRSVKGAEALLARARAGLRAELSRDGGALHG